MPKLKAVPTSAK